MRGHVWKAAIAAVEKRSEVGESFLADMVFQVIGNGCRLVLWTGKIVAEASRACNPSYLWFDGLSPANRGYIRAGTRKLRCELRGLFAII